MPGTQVTEYSNLPYIDGGLSVKEVYWRDHYQWLLECGYRLRPRYDPAWIPSWIKSGRLPALCEDWHGLLVCVIVALLMLLSDDMLRKVQTNHRCSRC
jgi:hypothetical protein